MSNLVVQTNVLALNSHRNLRTVGNNQATASARLSSGYRVNSAADDAAGLAISEKMRAQIRGLDMATKNTQDGISLVQTAEGAMQEIDNMIQRIRELVVQAANDTNDQLTGDRQKIQGEIDQLTQGIDNMAKQSEFNAKKLLDGSLLDSKTRNDLLTEVSDKLTKSLGSLASASNISQFGAAIAAGTGGLGTVGANLNTQGVTATNPSTQLTATANVNFTAPSASNWTSYAGTGPALGNPSYAANTTLWDGTTTRSISSDVTNTSLETMSAFSSTSGTSVSTTSSSVQTDSTTFAAFTSTLAGVASSNLFAGGKLDASAVNNYIKQIDEYVSNVNSAKKAAAGSGTSFDFDKLVTDANKIRVDVRSAFDALTLADAQIKSQTALKNTNGEALWFQTGANSGQGLEVGIGRLNTDIMGIGDGSGVTTLHIDQADGQAISTYVDIVNEALQYVTAQRAKLGAVQNRLEYTKSSLEINSENLSASESRIRDADMAKEMMKMTAANVLQQAGVSMLAQANQAPQSVLQLLR